MNNSEPSPEETCRDINTICAWLALDDLAPAAPDNDLLPGVGAIVLLGNQVLATLTEACALAKRLPQARLLLSGGVGHATGLLFENLRHSPWRELIDDGSISSAMPEARIYAALARRKLGIQPERLLIDDRSANAGENARFSLQLLREAGLCSGTVVLLQDPIMQRRSVLTWDREAELAGASSRVLSHAAFVPRVEPGSGALPWLVASQRRGTWTTERFLGLLLGEISRLNDDECGYGPKGRNFLPHVEIPEHVWRSYRRLAGSSLAANAAR